MKSSFAVLFALAIAISAIHTAAQTAAQTPNLNINQSQRSEDLDDTVSVWAHNLLSAIMNSDIPSIRQLWDDTTVLEMEGAFPSSGVYKGIKGLDEFIARGIKSFSLTNLQPSILAVDETRGYALLNFGLSGSFIRNVPMQQQGAMQGGMQQGAVLHKKGHKAAQQPKPPVAQTQPVSQPLPQAAQPQTPAAAQAPVAQTPQAQVTQPQALQTPQQTAITQQQGLQTPQQQAAQTVPQQQIGAQQNLQTPSQQDQTALLQNTNLICHTNFFLSTGKISRVSCLVDNIDQALAASWPRAHKLMYSLIEEKYRSGILDQNSPFFKLIAPNAQFRFNMFPQNFLNKEVYTGPQGLYEFINEVWNKILLQSCGNVIPRDQIATIMQQVFQSAQPSSFEQSLGHQGGVQQQGGIQGGVQQGGVQQPGLQQGTAQQQPGVVQGQQGVAQTGPIRHLLQVAQQGTAQASIPQQNVPQPNVPQQTVPQQNIPQQSIPQQQPVGSQQFGRGQFGARLREWEPLQICEPAFRLLKSLFEKLSEKVVSPLYADDNQFVWEILVPGKFLDTFYTGPKELFWMPMELYRDERYVISATFDNSGLLSALNVYNNKIYGPWELYPTPQLPLGFADRVQQLATQQGRMQGQQQMGTIPQAGVQQPGIQQQPVSGAQPTTTQQPVAQQPIAQQPVVQQGGVQKPVT